MRLPPFLAAVAVAGRRATATAGAFRPDSTVDGRGFPPPTKRPGGVARARRSPTTLSSPAGVAELADAPGLGPGGLRPLEVRLLSPASGPADRSGQVLEEGADRLTVLRRRIGARRSEVDQRDELLVGAQADGGLALWRLQELRRPPVGGEAAGMRGEQDDVDGARRRQHVLVVLVVVSGLRRARDDQ